MEAILVIILVGAVSGALGLLIGRYLWPAPSNADQIALSTTRVEATRLAEEVVGLKAGAGTLQSELQLKTTAFQEEEKKSARLEERVSAFERQLAEQVAALAEQLREAIATRDNALSDVNALAEKVARLGERELSLTKEIEELRAEDGKLQATLKTEFENIATKVLKANALELSDTSNKQIAAILDPLRERILEFEGKVEKTYSDEHREVLALKEQIKLIVETSQNLGTQADGLAKALKGDVQLLGRWGELVLDRILVAAGLQEGREYITQGRGLGLKNEIGGSQKPDVILLLPEKRTMIVDSKVSLASYDRLITAKEEADRIDHATQFVRDMKAHIDGLSGKRYQDNEQIAAHDCVLMFVPIEGALAAALTAEPELFTYAWDKRVVLVGPPTLLMTLRTVASIWRYELQAQNAQEIARLAGALCDKISASLIDLNTVSDRMKQAADAHNEAVKRLSTGRGNVLSIGARIRTLGVQTKEPLPAVLVDGERVSAVLEFDGDADPSNQSEDDVTK